MTRYTAIHNTAHGCILCMSIHEHTCVRFMLELQVVFIGKNFSNTVTVWPVTCMGVDKSPPN